MHNYSFKEGRSIDHLGPLFYLNETHKYTNFYSRKFSFFLHKEISEIFEVKFSVSRGITLFNPCVQAGTPPCEAEFMMTPLDLKEHLIKNEEETFLIRVAGESMINAGIFPDDLLVVDRSLQAVSGNVIIALLNGGLTVKRLYQHKERVILCAENNNFSDIKIGKGDSFSIWGVVTNVIRSLK